MSLLHCRIYGLPMAQGRPRAFRMNTGGSGRVRLVDPEASRDWKRTVLAQVLPLRPEAPSGRPLALTARFFLPRPKSAPRRVVYPVVRPDCDNLAKAILDALKGVVFVDDCQIVSLAVSKEYGVPGVEIVIDEVGQADLPAGAESRRAMVVEAVE